MTAISEHSVLRIRLEGGWSSTPQSRLGNDLDSGDIRDSHGTVDRCSDLVGIGSAELEGEQALTEFGLGRARQIGHRGAYIGEDDRLAEKRNRLRGGRAGLDDQSGGERGGAGARGWGRGRCRFGTR